MLVSAAVIRVSTQCLVPSIVCACVIYVLRMEIFKGARGMLDLIIPSFSAFDLARNVNQKEKKSAKLKSVRRILTQK